MTLEVTGLTCHRGGAAVLDDVTLALAAGEVLAVVGPNGAGKTSLLRAMARLLRPTAGRVTLGGEDLWARPAGWAARRVALAVQDPPGDWPLTVRDSVLLGRAAHRGWLLPFTRDDRRLVDRALSELGLSALADRPVTRLSDGEYQRVLLARALAQEPRVLLLDEPTAHLDLRFQVEVMGTLRRLARDRGLAVAVTLHDLNLAGPWADRVALLARGRLLAEGPPAAVLTPERLADAYDIAVRIDPHPAHPSPLITPLPPRT